MRGLLIFAAFLAILVFFLPFILGLAFFVICTAALLLLLARFGLLPGMIYRSYTFDTRGNRRNHSETREAPPSSSSPGGWYQEEQDGEIVTLPESALKRDDE